MALVGESIDNGRGERCVWIETSESSNGEVTVMDVFLQPDAKSPPAHIHLKQTERFEVLEGTIELKVGRERRRVSAGEEASIAPGIAHTWAPVGTQPSRVRVELRPALHFEEIQEAIFWMARNGVMDDRSFSNLLQAATVFHHHLDEARVASPPAIVQRIVLGVFAAIGRRRGYTAHPR